MSAYVYRCFDDNGRLVYVGYTGNLFERLRSHATAWWAPQVVKVKASVYSSRVDARAVERHAIASESPRWNFQGRWQSNSLWDRTDFHDYVQARSASPLPLTAWTKRHFQVVACVYRARFGEEMPFELPTPTSYPVSTGVAA